MTVREFEQKVQRREHITIRVRAPANTPVGEYDFARQAAGSSRVSEWLANRITPRLREHEVSVIGGDYQEPHGAMLLQTLRQSYT